MLCILIISTAFVPIDGVNLTKELFGYVTFSKSDYWGKNKFAGTLTKKIFKKNKTESVTVATLIHMPHLLTQIHTQANFLLASSIKSVDNHGQIICLR